MSVTRGRGAGSRETGPVAILERRLHHRNVERALFIEDGSPPTNRRRSPVSSILPDSPSFEAPVYGTVFC